MLIFLSSVKTHACENEVLLLECPRAEILRISHAVFGRFSLSLCNPDGDTMMSDLTCRSDSSTPVVANKWVFFSLCVHVCMWIGHMNHVARLLV